MQPLFDERSGRRALVIHDYTRVVYRVTRCHKGVVVVEIPSAGRARVVRPPILQTLVRVGVRVHRRGGRIGRAPISIWYCAGALCAFLSRLGTSRPEGDTPEYGLASGWVCETGESSVEHVAWTKVIVFGEHLRKEATAFLGGRMGACCRSRQSGQAVRSTQAPLSYPSCQSRNGLACFTDWGCRCTLGTTWRLCNHALSELDPGKH